MTCGAQVSGGVADRKGKILGGESPTAAHPKPVVSGEQKGIVIRTLPGPGEDAPAAAQLVNFDRLGPLDIAIGRLLLLITGVVVSSTVALLHPTDRDWDVVAAMSAAMLGILVVTLLAPWALLRRATRLVFPGSIFLSLGIMGALSTGDITSAYLGLFVLCFAYIGLFLPAWTSLAMLPVALPCYVLCIPHWTTALAIRLVIAVVIWLLLAELLAALMARQKLAAAVLQEAALTDPLTNLGNRRALEQRMVGMRAGDSVVICDLDHFKALNDTLGHAAGDLVLRDFGATLTLCLRGEDYAARFGGEEFVLLLADTDTGQAFDVMGRIRRRWAEVHPEVTFSAGFSVHAATAAPQYDLEQADLALYAAKAAGRDRVHAARDLTRA